MANLDSPRLLRKVGMALPDLSRPLLISSLKIPTKNIFVPDESAATALKVDAGVVEREVDGVGRAVVVRPQERLLVGPVPHDEVHERPRRLKRQKRQNR